MKKTIAERWKEHFASLTAKQAELEAELIDEEAEPEVEFEIEIEEEEESPKQSKTKNNKDLRRLIFARELLRRQAEIEEEKSRAQDLREVDQTNYVVNPTSIEAYLLRVLVPTEESLHINDIIERIEALGWVSTSKYHKYSRVHSALRKNYFMFMKVGKAEFKLREGFRGRKPEKIVRIVAQENEPAKLITIKDIVYDVSKTYQDAEGTYPSRVHNIMKRIGYKCNYSSVYRAMQSDLFTRDGFWYKPNDLCVPAKEVQNREP